jgi:hypothetical protein
MMLHIYDTYLLQVYLLEVPIQTTTGNVFPAASLTRTLHLSSVCVVGLEM